MDSEIAQCARCKKMLPKAELRHLWKFPLLVLRLAHMTPGKEGECLYCKSCARSQNNGVIFLALLFSIAVAIPGTHTFLLYGVLGGWALGLVIWLALFVRYRIRIIIFK